MAMKLTIHDGKTNPAVIICAKLLNVKLESGKTTRLEVGGSGLNQEASILRFFARQTQELGGSDIEEQAQVGHWIDYALSGMSKQDPMHAVTYLNTILEKRTWLLGNQPSFSAADVALYCAITGNKAIQSVIATNKDSLANLVRWVSGCSQHKAFADAGKVNLSQQKSQRSKSDRSKANTKVDQGKFVELEGAVEGQVCTRFPPEASGYLHIGHAKAAFLNEYFARTYKGKMIMRFDDTNPAKENAEFEKVILEDLSLLGIKYDVLTHTSDHFDTLLGYCEKLIKEGKAFADDTPSEQLAEQRKAMKPSPCRNNTVEQNLALWEEMQKATEKGQTCIIRAKIDYKSLNGALRDPTIYRCKAEAHVRTGDKYKVYPTYDFACPIVDSIEGVTHALRTTEYHDRDNQYKWVAEACGLRVPRVWDFSRLNMVYTVMSKRQLTWFVNENKVDGWSDPRFPTVRGILRQGMTVEALRTFILAMGSSKSDVQMEWDKFWATNKKVIDPVAPRHTAIEAKRAAKVIVKGIDGVAKTERPLHPKNPEVGTKMVTYSSTCLLEQTDAAAVSVGEKITLMDWGNVKVLDIKKLGKIVKEITVELMLDDHDFKKTQKFSWIAESEEEHQVEVEAVEYTPLITREYIPKGESIDQYLSTQSRHSIKMLGASSLADVQLGEIIQINRKGFFICDQPHHRLLEKPIRLIYIPDGHNKRFIADRSVEEEATCTLEEYEHMQSEVQRHSKICTEMRKKKADKADIKAAQAVLKQLESDFAEMVPPKQGESTSSSTPATDSTSSAEAEKLLEQIAAQAAKVRELKTAKAGEAEVKAAVDALLALKKQYKDLTGQDVPRADGGKSKKDKKKDKKQQKQQSSAPAPASDAAISPEAQAILDKVTEQGAKVRELKTAKAGEAEVKAAVDALLALKKQYKDLTGQDVPRADGGKSKKDKKKDKKQQKEQSSSTSVAAYPQPSSTMEVEAIQLADAIKSQGDVVRKLKADKADAETIKVAVDDLLKLKATYKEMTGEDVPQAKSSRSDKKKKKADKPKADAKAQPAKGVTRLGLEAKKEESISDWYTQVITKAEMIDYYDVAGCYVLRPWSYAIWEHIKDFFDAEIKKLGVQNTYFPMFVSQAALEREKDHIEDFAPEVAWVTKSGQSEMDCPIAIRPTSETVMYPSFAKWVQSHRDLPIRINQWANVVRWEFKQATPFLRTREFLWQEGHTAFADKPDADAEVRTILDLYRQVYEDLLAIPVVPGRKTEKEKFAGGDYTTTVEAWIGASGRAIQGATSHHLGQNFSKMFNITYQNTETGKPEHVFQNSWGITTRTIGVMVMVHGDNKGLVLPPRVAAIQTVIIPVGITAKTTKEDIDKIFSACGALKDRLNAAGIRAHLDDTDHNTPAWKFNHYELKGVPLRIEVGPRDLAKNQVFSARRDTGEKEALALDGIEELVQTKLNAIHASMFAKAKQDLDTHVKQITSWDDFKPSLNQHNMLLVPFCGEKECEEKIKAESAKTDDGEEVDPTAPSMGAKSLCIPFNQPEESCKGGKCIFPGCKKPSLMWTLFGRSY